MKCVSNNINNKYEVCIEVWRREKKGGVVGTSGIGE